jgi:hypothetical protein
MSTANEDGAPSAVTVIPSIASARAGAYIDPLTAIVRTPPRPPTASAPPFQFGRRLETTREALLLLFDTALLAFPPLTADTANPTRRAHALNVVALLRMRLFNLRRQRHRSPSSSSLFL